MRWFDLALALGRTVAELQATMSSAEFNEWQAYGVIRPFGEARADFRMAQICAITAAPHTPKGKRPLAPIDFIPEMTNESKPQDVKTFLRAFAAMHNKPER